MYPLKDMILNGTYFKKIHKKMCYGISQKYELNYFQICILMFLYETPEYDTAKKIIAVYPFSKSNVSNAVDALMKGGYIASSKNSADKRCVHLKLQESANDIIKDMLKIKQEFFEMLGEGISLEEKEQFEKIINKINSNVKEALKKMI